MVATRDGPISMCVHNAKRDHYVLAPIDLNNGRVWEPLSGKERPVFHVINTDEVGPEGLPLKRLKGRWRAKHLASERSVRPKVAAGARAVRGAPAFLFDRSVTNHNHSDRSDFRPSSLARSGGMA